MQTSTLIGAVTPVCSRPLALKPQHPQSSCIQSIFYPNTPVSCLAQRDALQGPSPTRLTQRKPKLSLRYESNPKLDLHQVLRFLKGGVSMQAGVYRYLSELREQSKSSEDFILSVLKAYSNPIPDWFSQKYADWLSKQADGESQLLNLARYESVDRGLRVACALQLSFGQDTEAPKVLGLFLLCQDFLSYRRYILKNIRDAQLKDKLLVCLIQDKGWHHLFENAFRLSYIQAIKDPRLRTDMAFSFIMDRLHTDSVPLSKAAALIEDEDLREKVLETIQTGVDFRGIGQTKNARKT